ncbi:MAG TPA: hypothetical protein VGG37_01830 [Opitutaceae bacterium]|jgi:hypothetical protein
MASKPKTYRRLTRNSSSLAGYTSLWAASDHLLIAFSSGYNERYSRIEFRDVKAFIVTDSSRRGVWTTIYAGMTGLALLVSLSFLISKSSFYISGILFVLGLVGLGVNASLGPACEVFVVTDVQVTKVPALRRLRKARKVLYQLEPLIGEAQAGAADPAAAPEQVPPLPQ